MHSEDIELIEAINKATDAALSKGVRVLQTHFYGTQREHVLRHLAEMNPPQGAHIVDAGSGIGEVARIMLEARPDLQFTLVNVSEYQLSMSPDGCAQVLADFTSSGLEAGCADVVMFNSALCQMPINQALSEARRLLKVGGQLFVSDLAIDHYQEFPELYATFMPVAQWSEVIGRHGFECQAVNAEPGYDAEHFRTAFDDVACFDTMMTGLQPFVARFAKQAIDRHVSDAIASHERIALQFSGGKDSLATLFLLKDHWPKITVYWTNTGDPVPEVAAVVAKVKAMVPNFVEIHGRVVEQNEVFGMPSDLVPTTSTPIGISAYGKGERLQDRFQCCYKSLMEPMQERMALDGVTLIIRGQKTADTMKSPLRSGAIEGATELLFPIEDWTDDQVFAWLEQHAFVPDYYKELAASPDCLTCSAYWSEGRAAWLKRKHPQAYAQYQLKLDIIREAVMPHIAVFNLEVSQ